MCYNYISCAVTDVADMDMKENILDHMIQNCTRQLRMLTEDSENARYPSNILYSCSLPFFCQARTVVVKGVVAELGLEW